MCNLPNWQIMIVAIVTQLAYMGLEAWLGVTKRTEAASVLELVWKLIFKPKEKP